MSGEESPSAARAPLPLLPFDWLLADAAAQGFARRAPNFSARKTLSAGQRKGIARTFTASGIAGLLVPQSLLMAVAVLAPLVFGATILFRLFLVAVARMPRLGPAPRMRGVTPLLPVYTALVAMKDEAATIPQLARALRGLDYPETLLDLKLLIEEGDEATRRAIAAERLPSRTELITVPPGSPQTKPRALNDGLLRARGAYVVVYDAEDRPHPGQLRAAVDAFTRAGPQTVCLQAPLVGVPAKSGWLARQWALEYALQFGLVVPALARLGWRVGMIASPTREAPPEEGSVWLAQRSRWLKGYVQTWLVLMRTPAAGMGRQRLAGFVSTQLTLGAAILSAIVHGPWAVWRAACLLSPHLSLGPLGSGALALSLTSGVLSALAAPGRSGWQRAFDIATLPLYWPLQTLAMVRALWSLARTPHYWAKTPHV